MDLKSLIKEQATDIIQYRRDLHGIPETGFNEVKTAAYIKNELEKLGLSPKTQIAHHGIIATLAGKDPNQGKTLLIRADMDGLAIQEETNLPFASTHKGFMHACGHDGHSAMVLGAARVLKSLAPQLKGNLKFLFQPAEEGPGGAKPMIEAGAMENPSVDYVVGAHLWPALAHGKLGIKGGPLMAAMDFFELTLKGKGGHGAMPHLCTDPIDTAVQVINALQRIASRQMNPISPTVVTVGSIQGGSSHNIIPDEVLIKGTTRTFDKGVWNTWPQKMETIIKGVCQSMGADYDFDYKQGYPPTLNDDAMAEQLKKSGEKVVGKGNIVEPEPTMGGEDISFFLERAKGCYVFIGTGTPGCPPLHNSKFDFDENLLLTGVELYCQTALDLLA